MISAQLRIRLPTGLWTRALSESFSETRFTLLSGYRFGDTATEIGEIAADDPGPCRDAMEHHDAITAFELLEADGDRVLGKYETTDTHLYTFVERSELPIEFPVVARNGWFTFDLTGKRAELDRLRKALEREEIEYALESLVGRVEHDGLLTDRQHEVLAAAVRSGYYEVPRECTLAELAAALGIDKATASTIIRRGEAALIKRTLTGVSGPDARR